MMVPAQKLQQHVAQTLSLTPQLCQAIKLLEYTNIQLNEFIEEQLTENPFLESECSNISSEHDSLAAEDKLTRDQMTGEISKNLLKATHSSSQNTRDLGTRPNYAKALQLVQRSIVDPQYSESMDSPFGVDKATYQYGKCLKSHLREQLSFGIKNSVKKYLCLYLIDSIDESGYLTEDISSIASKTDATDLQIQEALSILQNFDPPGLFARDLRECLQLQIERLDAVSSATEILLDNLMLLAHDDLNSLVLLSGLSKEQIIKAAVLIKGLDPKPGLQFNADATSVIVPDVFIRLCDQGTWSIELNNQTIHHVAINSQHRAQVLQKEQTPEEAQYVSQQLQQAKWLMRSIEQRTKTILKVTKEVVEEQSAFLSCDSPFLNPLSMRQIADRVSVHESTVSRVVAGKYMSTPRGTILFRDLFASAIYSKHTNKTCSGAAVRQRIKQLTLDEDKTNVLTDSRIQSILKIEGICVARRTIAKYREILRIPSSSKRRQKRQ